MLLTVKQLALMLACSGMLTLLILRLAIPQVVSVAPIPILPPDAIVLFLLSSCPAGYIESPVFNGRTPMGTLSSSANIGTTGGVDTITPAGTVTAPTFTGSSLAGHQHELPFHLALTNPQYRQLSPAVFGTGTSRAAAYQTGPLQSNTTAAAVALSQSISAGIPSGVNSAPAFNGASFDNRSAFIRVIFCKKL
jgi:hypothetical protein